MQKIPTIFERDETTKGHPVINQVKPECQWVLDGEGICTVKIDGTNVKIASGVLWKRQKPKTGDYDEAAYVPCNRDDPADQWAYEAFDAFLATADGRVANIDGVYELIGPKINGNPHRNPHHELVRVVPSLALQISEFNMGVTRSYDGFREMFSAQDFRWEGFVFHHPDGRLAKIKVRDYGLPWPPRTALAEGGPPVRHDQEHDVADVATGAQMTLPVGTVVTVHGYAVALLQATPVEAHQTTIDAIREREDEIAKLAAAGQGTLL